MGRQTRKTRQAIFTAFITLLNQKKYSKITMQEIADLADVGRSTIYSHFETKEDLLADMCRNIFEDMLMSGHTASDSPESMLVAILVHIKENKKVITGLFACDGLDIFFEYCKQFLSSIITAPLLAGYDETTSSLPKDYLLNHLVGSFMETVKWWVNNRMELSPEDVAQYYSRVTNPVIDVLISGNAKRPLIL